MIEFNSPSVKSAAIEFGSTRLAFSNALRLLKVQDFDHLTRLLEQLSRFVMRLLGFGGCDPFGSESHEILSGTVRPDRTGCIEGGLLKSRQRSGRCKVVVKCHRVLRGG